MTYVFANHDLDTEACGQLIDVADDVLDVVGSSGVRNGTALVYTPHTTCAVVINENESGFLEDFASALCELVPALDRYYKHDDLEIRTQGIEPETAEFPNGHSHVRAGLLSSTSQTIPIVEGTLMLGVWQRVFLCELDRARSRKVLIQVVGE